MSRFTRPRSRWERLADGMLVGLGGLIYSVAFLILAPIIIPAWIVGVYLWKVAKVE